MTNAELVSKISSTVIHPAENTNVNDMMTALEEYINLVPGKNNELPTYRKISGRDKIVILTLVNAILYDDYKPTPLTDADKDYFHPERQSWLDGKPHYRQDYIVYLDFLEQAVVRLSKLIKGDA